MYHSNAQPQFAILPEPIGDIFPAVAAFDGDGGFTLWIDVEA